MSLQDKVKQMSKVLESRVRESNGFLTKKDGYLSKAEWHASMIGVSIIGLGYILPSPLGELMILMIPMMHRYGWKKVLSKKKLTGHTADVIHESGYTFGFAFVTAVFFHYFTSHSLTSIDLGNIGRILLLGG